MVPSLTATSFSTVLPDPKFTNSKSKELLITLLAIVIVSTVKLLENNLVESTNDFTTESIVNRKTSVSAPIVVSGVIEVVLSESVMLLNDTASVLLKPS